MLLYSIALRTLFHFHNFDLLEEQEGLMRESSVLLYSIPPRTLLLSPHIMINPYIVLRFAIVYSERPERRSYLLSGLKSWLVLMRIIVYLCYH